MEDVGTWRMADAGSAAGQKGGLEVWMNTDNKDVRISMEDKLVSVLMAVKNEEKYIAEALASVLGQTYRHLEVIVINDHSEDATLELAEAIAAQDPRVIVQDGRGHGKVSAFNQAWQLSRGDIIVLFAGDDILPVDSIAQRVELLAEAGTHVATGKVKSFSAMAKYDGLVLPKKGPSLGGGATAFSRYFSNLMFPIPEQLPNEDSWTKLHIDAFAGTVAWNDRVIHYYRIHEGNSMAFGSSFQRKRLLLDKRSLAFQLFLEKYQHMLSASVLLQIQSLVRLHQLRSAGNFWGILKLPNIPLKQKSAAISYCNPFFYAIRVRLERHLLGR